MRALYLKHEAVAVYVSKVYDDVSNVQITTEREHIWITLYWMQILCLQLLM